MQTRLDPISLLERSDKWSVGGGKAAVFAPPFPAHLDVPGFWDAVHFADIRLDRLFCILTLDDQGRPLLLHRASRRWSPACLTQLYTIEGRPRLRLQEERVITPNDTVACRLTLINSSPEPVRVHFILWSLQDGPTPGAEETTTIAAVERDLDGFSFAHRMLHGEGDPSHAVYVALGGSRLPDSHAVCLTEAGDGSPCWEVSIVPEKFRNGRLSMEPAGDGAPASGDRLHLALHYSAEAAAGDSDAVTFGAGIALSRDAALEQIRADMTVDVIALSRENWQRYFQSLPYFECSDPGLERIYWSRWHSLRLMRVDVAAGNLPHPCIFDRAGDRHAQSARFAACQAREAVWLRDPAPAMGSLENFLHAQIRREDEDKDDGSLPGRLQIWSRSPGSSDANWGAAALQIFQITGDLHFVRRVYPGLVRYAEYFDRERDATGSGLYDSQPEPGTEAPGDQSAHKEFPAVAGTMKGVETACNLYELHRALAVFARAVGQEDDAAWWNEKAETTAEAVCELMWDAGAGLFKDVDGETLTCAARRQAAGFFPFLSDIAGPEHLAAFAENLFDPVRFGTPYPTPAVSIDDPSFDAQGIARGKRRNAPGLGRVQPAPASYVAEALAHTARTLAPEMRAAAADHIHRLVRMFFQDGDVKRPNSYEHYNPFTGAASLYRGHDDCPHGFIIDLLIRHVVGIQPEPGPHGELIVDPLPFGLKRFRLEGASVRGHIVDVWWSLAEGFVVRVDGRDRIQLPSVQWAEIALGSPIGAAAGNGPI